VAIGVGGSMTNLQPLLMDRGFEASRAAQVTGVIGASVIGGRLLAGYLIDRYWAPLVTLPMLALPAISCLLLAQPQVSLPAALLSAALIGLANYGRLYGLQYAVFGFASGFSPFLFGRVFDSTGTYQPILYAAAVLFVVGALALLALGPYPRFEEPATG
jgi:predicted MFS family arabinose efflux permease